jgi:hypothetical protein
LRVERGARRLELRGDGLLLRSRAAEPAGLARDLRKSLAQLARAAAAPLLAEEAARLGLAYSALRIGDPVSLWGSCGAGGRISLSWRLLLAPPEVFRYVVVHELCHLRWRSHGPRFWGLVERQMPEFEVHRRWLREHGGALHAAVPRG